jgi:Ca2+-binding EF-hand superfamily protein
MSIAEQWLAAAAEPAQLEAMLGASGASPSQSGLDSILGAQLFNSLAHAAVVEQQAAPIAAAAAARPSVHISRRGSVNISMRGGDAAPAPAAPAPRSPEAYLGTQARSLAEHNIELRAELEEAAASQRGLAARLRSAEMNRAALMDERALSEEAARDREESMTSAAALSRESVVQEAERQFAAMFEAKVAALITEHDSTLEAQRQSYSSALEALERELRDSVAERAVLGERAVLERSAHNEAVKAHAAERVGWSTRFAELSSERDAALEALARSHAVALDELRASYEAELKASAARRRAEVGALAFQGHAELDAVATTNEEALNAAESRHEAALAAALEAQRVTLTAQFEVSKSEALARDAAAREARMSDLVAREARLGEDFTERASAAAVEEQRALRRHERQFATLKAQLVDDLELRLDAARRDISASLRREAASEIGAAQREIARLQGELRDARAGAVQTERRARASPAPGGSGARPAVHINRRGSVDIAMRGGAAAMTSSPLAAPPPVAAAQPSASPFSPATPVAPFVRSRVAPFTPRDLGWLARTLGDVSLADFFHDVDAGTGNSSGALDLAAFTRAFRRRQIASAHLSNAQLAALFQAIDAAGTGVIELRQLVRFIEEHGGAGRSPSLSESGRRSAAKRSMQRRSALASFEARTETLAPVQKLIVRIVREVEKRNLKPSSMFHFLDRRRQDTLTKGDFASGMREMLGIELTQAEMALVFRALDADGSNRISYAEWKALDKAPALLRRLAPAGSASAKSGRRALRNAIGANGAQAEAAAAKVAAPAGQADVGDIAWRLRVSVHSTRIAAAARGLQMGTRGGLVELFAQGDGADGTDGSDGGAGVTFQGFCSRLRGAGGVTALEVGDTELAWLFMAIDAEGRERVSALQIASYVTVLAGEAQRVRGQRGASASSPARSAAAAEKEAEVRFPTAGHRVAWTVLCDLSRGEDGTKWVKRVRTIFAQMDLDGDGRLAEGEFRMALLGLGVFLEEDQAAALFGLILDAPAAEGAEGTVHYDRFLALFDPLPGAPGAVAAGATAVAAAGPPSVRTATTELVILQIREGLGPDRGDAPDLPVLFRSGASSLACDDFVAALRSAGIPAGKPSAKELASLFVEVDTDADGLVTREELAACFACAWPPWGRH